jgi:hypothetical protein
VNKSEAKKLVEKMRDYIPGGARVADVKALTFRRTREDEVILCGAQTGDDLQSGPCFCGKIAEWVARTSGGVAAICDRHAKLMGVQREGV